VDRQRHTKSIILSGLLLARSNRCRVDEQLVNTTHRISIFASDGFQSTRLRGSRDLELDEEDSKRTALTSRISREVRTDPTSRSTRVAARLARCLRKASIMVLCSINYATFGGSRVLHGEQWLCIQVARRRPSSTSLYFELNIGRCELAISSREASSARRANGRVYRAKLRPTSTDSEIFLIFRGNGGRPNGNLWRSRALQSYCRIRAGEFRAITQRSFCAIFFLFLHFHRATCFCFPG